MTKLILPSGATGFTNDAGQWICTGSQMGRPNILPASADRVIKLRLTRLPFVDGCYDRWGAYWGAPATVWCAWNETAGDWFSNWDNNVMKTPHRPEIFVRADSRDEAKQKVRQLLPLARFYR